MEKYSYDEKQRQIIEHSCIPLAIYQFINHRVVTIALSDGFIELFGFQHEDRPDVYALMDNDMYRDAHPDDVGRISDAGVRFATEGGEYNASYRSLIGGDYHIIRAQGKHIYTDNGVRLAVIWYADEGLYDEVREAAYDRQLAEDIIKSNRFLKGSYDPMTGLPGVNYFFELGDAAFRQMLEEGEQPAVLFFDFNGMKGFNERFGFSEGDKLILAMSRVLIRHFSTENCCRFGGDRFAVYTKKAGLEETLAHLLTDVKEINNGNNLPVRIGIYLHQMEAVGIGVACDRAKMACDTLRDSGQSAYSYFNEKLLQSIQHRQYILDNLDRAIREGWIQVYYQPIVRAANGRVCDEEALARWIDPPPATSSPCWRSPA